MPAGGSYAIAILRIAEKLFISLKCINKTEKIAGKKPATTHSRNANIQ